MKKAIIAAAALATMMAIIALFIFFIGSGDNARPLEPERAADPDFSYETTTEDYEGFLYGRITTVEGETHEGRLRFGGRQEAFWGDYFNGFKDENPWADAVAIERITERYPIEIFGVEIGGVDRRINLDRPFMARFGDIASIEGLETILGKQPPHLP